MRAAALRQNRRAPPVASWPIMAPTWIACPLRSTDITPLHHYYQESVPQHRIRTLALVVPATCDFSVSIDTEVLMFQRLFQAQPTCMPDATPSVSRSRRSSSHDLLTSVVLTSSDSFRHENGGSLAVLFLEVT